MLMTRNIAPPPHRVAKRLESFRLQLAVSICLAVLTPALLVFGELAPTGLDTASKNSVFGSLLAVVVSLILVRRVTAFPGTHAFAYIIPTVASCFGIIIAAMLTLRLGYSRVYLSASFVTTLMVLFVIGFWIDRYGRPLFHVVPNGRMGALLDIPGVQWTIMTEPVVPQIPGAAIVADLRFDHDRAWERMLAAAAVEGHPVYHAKLLRESLTGRVTMEHLSENSFGSLLPNLAYRKIKRLFDLLACLVMLPLLLVPMILIALVIKLDSKGPVFFMQQRMGYRARIFRMVKFRTMHPRPQAMDEEAARQDAMTRSEDDRVTRVGRVLRRTRLDELPQIFNVLIGQMSWIGPRPEAAPLSNWYEREIPFYSYRHIVRPGISGWAQVHQGHVTDLDAINQKLAYDFYYIKYFSAWLDLVIAMRTIPTMLSGFGSK